MGDGCYHGTADGRESSVVVISALRVTGQETALRYTLDPVDTVKFAAKPS